MEGTGDKVTTIKAAAIVGLVIASLHAVSTAALANPCSDAALDPGAPIRAPGVSATLGAIPEACPVSSAALIARGRLLVAAEDFYGSLGAETTLEARVAIPAGAFISIVLPSLEHRFVANATLQATDLDVGPGALGLHVARLVSPRAIVAPFVRALTPVDFGGDKASRTGLDIGFSSGVLLQPKIELVGGASAALFASVARGRAHSMATLFQAADLVYRPYRAVTLAAGAGLRLGFAPARDSQGTSARAMRGGELLEGVEPRASVRLFPFRRAFVELAGALPFAGRDRTDLAAALRIGVLGNAGLVRGAAEPQTLH